MIRTDGDWRPRLSVDITPEQARALDRWIPHGFRGRIFGVLIDMLIVAFERGGAGVLLSVLERELDLPGVLVRKKGEN